MRIKFLDSSVAYELRGMRKFLNKVGTHIRKRKKCVREIVMKKNNRSNEKKRVTQKIVYYTVVYT